MAAEKKEKEGLFYKLSENANSRRIILAVGALGIVLIFLSSLFQGSGEKPKQAAEEKPTIQTAQEYTTALENSLTDLLSHVAGVSGVKVMITLERGAEQVYAQEEKRSVQNGQDKEENQTETTTILVKDSNGTQYALPITELQPVIKGVVVVCNGAEDPVVQQNITNAVTTALHITSVRVCVIKAK